MKLGEGAGVWEITPHFLTGDRGGCEVGGVKKFLLLAFVATLLLSGCGELPVKTVARSGDFYYAKTVKAKDVQKTLDDTFAPVKLANADVKVYREELDKVPVAQRNPAGAAEVQRRIDTLNLWVSGQLKEINAVMQQIQAQNNADSIRSSLDNINNTLNLPSYPPVYTR